MCFDRPLLSILNTLHCITLKFIDLLQVIDFNHYLHCFCEQAPWL